MFPDSYSRFVCSPTCRFPAVPTRKLNLFGLPEHQDCNLSYARRQIISFSASYAGIIVFLARFLSFIISAMVLLIKPALQAARANG